MRSDAPLPAAPLADPNGVERLDDAIYARSVVGGRKPQAKAQREIYNMTKRAALFLAAVATQSNATWGIDRVDQRALPLSGSFSYSNSGAGVKAYVIDSGITPTHQEVAGRVAGVRDFVGLPGEPWHTGGVDCNGHGTHVSGTVLGAG